MARSVLADGRTLDAARMIEPLIGDDAGGSEVGDVLLRCLMARIHLLGRDDVEGVFRVLGDYEDSTLRSQLDPAVRAEVALWLACALVWQDGPNHDAARALNLLDEAARTFRDNLNASGLCWALIGQAQAYLTIDEYQLMLQALDEASALRVKLNDIQAATWIAHLSVTGARFRGEYRTAERHVDEMLSLAGAFEDETAAGRAHAHQAVVAYDLGQPPAVILAAAHRAEAILKRATGRPGYTLLSAYHAHIGALVRQGEWDEAEKLAEAALMHLGHLEGAPAYVSLHRASILMYRGDLDRAERILDDIMASVQRQHRLLASTVARFYSELMLRRKRSAAAREWADRAYRGARETGYDAYELKALLQLARVSVQSADLDDARRHLREMEHYGRYFSVLPFAAEQFDVQGRLSLLRGRPDEARALLTQALSTWSMIGDAYETATTQYELARLTRTSSPNECRPLAEASFKTFERLGARREARRLRDLLRALPGSRGRAEQLSESDISAVLSRSALSVDLVAETWLRLAERIAPDRWMGVFQYDENDGWSAVRAHGDRSVALEYPDPLVDRLCSGGTDWIRLKTMPSSAFFFAMECGGEDDPACRVIEDRLSAWVPVAGLAFEHALLRGSSTTNTNGSRTTRDERHAELDGLVYSSEAMRVVVDKIDRLRSSHSPVLITGERGVGKNLVAALIHRTSDRSGTPYVVFNCATASRKRFAHQLFGDLPAADDPDGDENDVQASALDGRGALVAADEGTLFLDAIDETPLDLQLRLLSFVEHGEITATGHPEPVKLNVRIIAATNQDLQTLVGRGQFSEDLFFRLNVVPLRIPPLRDRRDDVPLLAQHFLRSLQTDRIQRVSISGRALDALIRYTWPGNVRQLRNEIERALVFTRSEPAPMIDVTDLSEPVAAALPADVALGERPNLLIETSMNGSGLDDILASAEKSVIERALAVHDGQVSATADTLGLTRQGLYKKMKRLGIEASRFQTGTGANAAPH